jgi:GNAT superfamily N-acetyltransferase
MIHAGPDLALRLEDLISAEFRRLAAIAPAVLPGVPAECMEVGGGVALWLGEGSPVNLGVGMGMIGPVGEAELERVEAFYHDRGAEAVISMCPLADPSLLEGLGRRGWRASGFEHVLALELGGRTPAGSVAADAGVAAGAGAATTGPAISATADVDVRVCTTEERKLWGQIAARGLADGEQPHRRHEEFGAIMAGHRDAVLVLAWVEGAPAGTGALVIDGGVGWLSGDSTLPQYRGRGVQQAIQRHRLLLAEGAGCDLAVTEAVPGGGSQRNMERLGFRIVYTHVEFAKSRAEVSGSRPPGG